MTASQQGAFSGEISEVLEDKQRLAASAGSL
jgi:hypothetical protein